jgi:hypothetical protein
MLAPMLGRAILVIHGQTDDAHSPCLQPLTLSAFPLAMTDRVDPGADCYLFLGRHLGMGVYRYIHNISGRYHKDDSLCLHSADYREGVRASGEKRRSVFKGC